MEGPRTIQQRRQDALAKLTEVHADVWVASASAEGIAHLVPLSYAWDGVCLIVVCDEASMTARNIRASSRARLALGGTRDVVMVDVVLEATVDGDAEGASTAEVYASQTDWDPREAEGDFAYLRLRPQRIQVWREANEIAGRLVMRDGAWID
jgi:hypothetical protein